MALESIFSAVFEKADQQLHLRWVSLKNELGLPHHINLTTLSKVVAFVEQELGALALQPNSNLNTGPHTGPPPTDNQKARSNQIKDSDKKRAAATQDKMDKQIIDGQNKAVAAALQANQKGAGNGIGKGGGKGDGK